MNLVTCKLLLTTVISTTLLFGGCKRSESHHHDEHGHGHGDGEAHKEEFARGPHRGRLLVEGDFKLELQIFETGVPPQYRIYAYKDGKQISPRDFTATVTLKRLGGRVDNFTFIPVNDFLTSDNPVEEPHSFDVEVKATYQGTQYSWQFNSYEGRTTIPEEVAARSGVKTEKATRRDIKTVLKTRGKIFPSEHKIAHIIPRFSGIVKDGKKHIGDKVEKGEVLAVIESNQSLQPFEVKSQISGTVINGHLIIGEFVPENQWVYIVADLSEVWADLFIPAREQISAKIGQKITVQATDESTAVEGVVGYVAPYADEKSQSQLIRVFLPNKSGLFLPGMFVTGDLSVEESKSTLAVKKEALQNFRDWQVVFVKVGDTYEIRPLELGKTDGDWVQVLSGLAEGDEYVTENAFLIKADILKAGASHDH